MHIKTHGFVLSLCLGIFIVISIALAIPQVAHAQCPVGSVCPTPPPSGGGGKRKTPTPVYVKPKLTATFTPTNTAEPTTTSTDTPMPTVTTGVPISNNGGSSNNSNGQVPAVQLSPAVQLPQVVQLIPAVQNPGSSFLPGPLGMIIGVLIIVVCLGGLFGLLIPAVQKSGDSHPGGLIGLLRRFFGNGSAKVELNPQPLPPKTSDGANQFLKITRATSDLSDFTDGMHPGGVEPDPTSFSGGGAKPGSSSITDGTHPGGVEPDPTSFSGGGAKLG